MTWQPHKTAGHVSVDLGMYQLWEGCDSWDDLCWEQQRAETAGLTCSGAAEGGVAQAGPL